MSSSHLPQGGASNSLSTGISANRRTTSGPSAAIAVSSGTTDPKRTTKTSSKLVVFPPASPPLVPRDVLSAGISLQPRPLNSASLELSPGEALGHVEFSATVNAGSAEYAPLPPPANTSSYSGPRTEAEQLSKEFRIHLPRVTCYCAADAYDIPDIARFLKTKHGVVGRQYDEALYISYEHRVIGAPGSAAYAQLMARHTARVLPNLPVSSAFTATNLADSLGGVPGTDGSKLDQAAGQMSLNTVPLESLHNIPSSSALGRSPRVNHTNFPDAFHGTFANFPETHLTDPHLSASTSTSDSIIADTEDPASLDEQRIPLDVDSSQISSQSAPILDDRRPSISGLRKRGGTGSPSMRSITPTGMMATSPRRSQQNLKATGEGDGKWMGRNEVFLFDFGVIVLWNFTAEEEQLYLSILKPFATNPRHASEAEIEDFHFQYDFSRLNQPRIYNDMITLKSGNPMIKLTISHGIAQSAKLTYFENTMEHEIVETSVLPKMMAKYGEVKLTRDDVLKIVGRLFKLRMNVNLVSNVLDTPEIFWSEPELQALYNAIRGYLEISQRVKLLNNRTGVVSDLLDMLSDHLHVSQQSLMTRIVIFLIVITCIVASAEVYVKILLDKATGHTV